MQGVKSKRTDKGFRGLRNSKERKMGSSGEQARKIYIPVKPKDIRKEITGEGASP